MIPQRQRPAEDDEGDEDGGDRSRALRIPVREDGAERRLTPAQLARELEPGAWIRGNAQLSGELVGGQLERYARPTETLVLRTPDGRRHRVGLYTVRRVVLDGRPPS